MNIAIVGPCFPHRGGIAHYTSLLAANLSRRCPTRLYGFEQQYPIGLFPGRSQIEPSSIPLVDVDSRRWLIPWLPSSWQKVSRDWMMYKPGLVIFQWWVPFMAPMTAWLIRQARRLEISTTVICHNVLPHEKNPLDGLVVRWALSHADRLFVHSFDDQSLAKKLLPHIQIERVSHPSYQAFKTPTWTREEARAALKIDGNVALFFGMIRPYKGLQDLLDALPAVLSQIDLTLLMVGEVWGDAKSYHRKIKQLGLESQVRVIDRYISNDDVAMYFAAADLVVLPYRYATGSGVLQLALGLGVPVVASRTGSFAEEIQDGENGFLVEPGNESELANAIVRFFREGHAATFRDAIQRNRARFEWDALIDALLKPVMERWSDA